MKLTEVSRKIGQQWNTLSPEEKRPFEVAALRDREQFKKDLEQYQARLTPAQIEQERRQMLAKRNATSKKRELTSLGKPKRQRSSFNIFMSEQFDKARGHDNMAKMKSMNDNWKRLLTYQKQVYIQQAEDDVVRYKNEMRSWENRMVEIGRIGLLRKHTINDRKRAAKKVTAAECAAERRLWLSQRKSTASKKSSKSKTTGGATGTIRRTK